MNKNGFIVKAISRSAKAMAVIGLLFLAAAASFGFGAYTSIRDGWFNKPVEASSPHYLGNIYLDGGKYTEVDGSQLYYNDYDYVFTENDKNKALYFFFFDFDDEGYITETAVCIMPLDVPVEEGALSGKTYCGSIKKRGASLEEDYKIETFIQTFADDLNAEGFDSDAFKSTLSEYVIDFTSTPKKAQTDAFIFIIIVLLLLIFPVISFKFLINPKPWKFYTNSKLGAEGISNEIDNEIERGGYLFNERYLYLSENYIAAVSGYSAYAYEISELVWAYKSVVVHRSYGIKVGKTVTFSLYFADGKKTAVQMSELDIANALQKLEEIGTVMLGYDPGMNNLTKKNRLNDLLAQWEDFKKQNRQ